MGSVGASRNENNSPRITTEEIKGTPLIFGTAMIRSATAEQSETVDIDGYSNKKTIAGAIGDLAKAVEKYSKDEADALRDLIKWKELVQIKPGPNYDGGYILEWEEVPGATRINPDTNENEYKDGRWYLHTRIVTS